MYAWQKLPRLSYRRRPGQGGYDVLIRRTGTLIGIVRLEEIPHTGRVGWSSYTTDGKLVADSDTRATAAEHLLPV